jgi:hypothetical protein
MTEIISIDTQRARAAKFAKRFEKASYEMGQAQRFVTDFCEIFGIDHRRLLNFEMRVKKSTGKRGRIDAFIPNLLLVEMKSAGENLDKAYLQATEYLQGLKSEDLPRSVLVSDFQNLHLYNLETHAEPVKIKLADLAQQIDHFRFLTGYEKIAIENQQKINEKAALKMGDLHDEIKKTGYDGKDLENYLVRLLFCLFADNTGLFGENGAFLNYLHNHTKIDGSDLHCALIGLFDTLNTKPEKRLNTLPESLAKFPYINGELFEGHLKFCCFDQDFRNMLIECAQMDWSEISPAIFGSLFQAVMHNEDEQGKAKTKKRREFGAHYTSEQNILKTIKPLFLDDLRAEFEKCTKQKLPAFHEKLAQLNFFDPACGCGNFLIVAYRELRLLEIDVLKKIYGNKLSQLDVSETLILCNVHQFHGIDIDDSAVHIATVAMWLVDHQMNLEVGKAFGNYFNRIPLVKKANIVRANALQIDWQSVISAKDCSFIMGNPPFRGKHYQSPEQKTDLDLVFQGMKGAGVLDFVAAWHVKAARYIQANPEIPVAFVSTNSLTQGEQVAILWTELLKLKVRLYFAHRTFRWSNEGRGVAAVHCVILGFGLQEPSSYRLFDYGDDIKGEPIEIKATQINPYLVDAPTLLIQKSAAPLFDDAPKMVYGNKPVDGGHLLLSPDEKQDLLAKEPQAEKWLRPLLGAEEFINGKERWCLWLVAIEPHELKAMPEVLKRVEAVKNMRLASIDPQAQELAQYPTQFRDIREPATYILIPRVSSEERKFIPVGFFDSRTISTDANFMLPDASLYHFGILNSTFHNAWTRAICGRLESRYRYSNTIVYNNFIWPKAIKSQITAIETKAQAILDARAEYKTSTLADLYNPLTMPANLVKAHNELDKAVDSAYKYKGTKDDAARVAFLFELYQKLTAPLIETEAAKKPRKIRAVK